jgi:hypothetical protein
MLKGQLCSQDYKMSTCYWSFRAKPPAAQESSLNRLDSAAHPRTPNKERDSEGQVQEVPQPVFGVT